MALKNLDGALRYFLHIAELGSLSKAADVLDLTQSSLSKQLSLLESHFGLPLFTRTGRGVELNEVGSRLFSELHPVFAEIDRVVEEIRQQSDTHGTVRLATVHTLSYYFTADVVTKFVNVRPHATMSLMCRSSPEVVELVSSGKADLGFVYDVAVDLGNVISTPLFLEEMSLIVRHDSSVNPCEKLESAALKLVGFPSHYALRRMLHSAGVHATYVAEADTVDMMLQLVSAGVGNCILPSLFPSKLLADYGLRKCQMGNSSLNRWVVAITRSDKPLPLFAKKFLECTMQVSSEVKT